MKKTIIRRTLCILLSLLMLLSVLAAIHVAAAKTPSKEAMLAGMTTEEKIAQMVMPTFRYYNGAAVTALNQKMKTIIKKRGFAGVILFAQNNASTAQTVQLIDELQTANAAKANRPQLLISVDQEGAGVSRLASGTAGPGNMALGATGNKHNAYDMGKIIGRELRAVGYNVDFAPVVDVNSNPANPVIGVRSFSDDAATVADFASNFMKGLHSRNIITALKHFPGHGDAATDSHTGLPRIEKTYAALQANELVPFARCIKDGAEMIMTAHIQYPLIEKATYVSKKDGRKIELPATLSKTIITDVLRGDLGFDGVVVTDSMAMAAIADHFAVLDTAKLAINAGVDMLLMPVDTGTAAGIDRLDQYITDVAALADAGKISMKNVNRAVMRILTLKEKKNLLASYPGVNLTAKKASAAALVGSEKNHKKEWAIAQKAVTLVKNANDVLPIKTAKKTVILVPRTSAVLSAEYAVERLKQDGCIPKSMNISVFLTDGKTLSKIKTAVHGAAYVIAVTMQSGEADLSADQYKNLDSVANAVHNSGGKIVFISSNLPYDVARVQKGDAILLAYSPKGMTVKPNFSAGSVATYGVNIPAAIYSAFDADAAFGTLPVNIPKLKANNKYTSNNLYKRGFGLQYKKDTSGQPASGDKLCKWDGVNHGTSFWGKLTTVLHSVLYFFAHLFGRR